MYMVYDIISFITILVSIAVIIVIVVRKFPKISSLRVEELQKERDSLAKKQVIKNRLKRIYHEHKKEARERVSPYVEKVFKGFVGARDKVKRFSLEMEKKRKKDLSSASSYEEELEKSQLELGWQYFNEKKYTESEEYFIAYLSKDATSLEAYEGLANVYIETKDYSKAKQTLIYLLKLANTMKNKDKHSISSGQLANYHFLFGVVCEAEGNRQYALEYYNKAHASDPKNPRYLDQLIGMSIEDKDVKKARDYLVELKMVNPGNKKIVEFEERIDQIRA